MNKYFRRLEPLPGWGGLWIVRFRVKDAAEIHVVVEYGELEF